MAPLLLFAAVGGILAVLVSVGIRYKQDGSSSPVVKSTSPTTTTESLNERTVFVIGDLHGDVDCGKYWVEKLQLADWENKKWLNPEATLVFLGDYCDKGPFSFQTMRFVKSLTDTFPDKVTALMGNHELELLRDRDVKTERKYMHLAWSAVHPGEYKNYLTERKWDEKDDFVLDVLLNASVEIYSNGWHQKVQITPHTSTNDKKVSITEILGEELRPLVSERLEEYQTAYLKAFASDTDLGQWVERLKVAHVELDTFFTHGGLHPKMVDEILSVGGVDSLNAIVKGNATTDKFVPFMDTWTGNVVYHMLVYRGNHDESNGCGGLEPILQDLGVKRLAVGHTPDENVRSLCDSQFWALDSLLGRWIRTSGNMYCPVKGSVSQNGRFVCDPIPSKCEGQIVKMTADRVEIIHP